MWSLLRRSSASPVVETGNAGDAAWQHLCEALLNQVADQNTKDSFAKQFATAIQTSGVEQTTQLAVFFETLLTFLREHQPPVLTRPLSETEIQTVITQYLDPTQLEPELIAALSTGTLQLAGVLGIGVERLTYLYYASMTEVQVREDLEYLLSHLPYQIPPEVYAKLVGSNKPSLRFLLMPLAQLGKEDLIANLRFLYQHYIDALIKNNQQPQAAAAMREVYAFISQTYPQELTLSFLDLVPAGWLEQERGNLLGREELLKVLDELEAEKAKLEVANIRDEALLASIGDGVVAADLTGKVIFVNESALRLVGLQTVRITNLNWFESVSILDKNDQPLAPDQNPMKLAITTQKPCVSNDLSFVRSDKVKLAVAITATPYIIQDKVAGAILVFKDMTHEREIDRQKTEFISVASHQLRTPLGSMKLNLEMLAKNYHGELPSDAQEVVKQTLDVNERTLKLVNTLLDISRIETGRVQDHPAEVNIGEVITKTLTEIQPLADEKKIQLKVEQPGELPKMSIDASRFQEILENILSNAIKYSLEGGQVTLTVKVEAEFLKLEVADQGIGIPEKDQFKVFSRFFRAENALNREPNGSGFGLFVVKSYIEGWGGKIWFESPTLENGTGTTFFLQIPLKIEVPVDGLYLDNREASQPTSELQTQESAV